VYSGPIIPQACIVHQKHNLGNTSSQHHQHRNHLYTNNPQSKPGHVYSKFTWGNKKSLWEAPAAAGLDVRDELLKYYG
jgi:secreted Zn-dependent insulinase-like peptidase